MDCCDRRENKDRSTRRSNSVHLIFEFVGSALTAQCQCWSSSMLLLWETWRKNWKLFSGRQDNLPRPNNQAEATSVSILPVKAIKWVICGVRLILYHHPNGHHLRTYTRTQTKRSQRRKASYLTWWMNTMTKNISNQLLTGMHYKVTKTDSQKSSKKDNYENKW